MILDFTDRHVVVTGGTGALGAAVVELLLRAGAICHIPAHRAPDPARFPQGRNEHVHLAEGIDLAEESAVASFYRSLPSLWASIHTAGGFAASAIAETTLADFRKMIDINAIT